MTQIFKTSIPSDLLFELLEKTCTKSQNFYIFDKNSYKKGIFTESISTFLANCKPHYFKSKQKYVECKITYNSFTTIIRQICNYHKITYTSEIKYDKSSYNIVYYIEDMLPKPESTTSTDTVPDI